MGVHGERYFKRLLKPSLHTRRSRRSQHLHPPAPNCLWGQQLLPPETRQRPDMRPAARSAEQSVKTLARWSLTPVHLALLPARLPCPALSRRCWCNPLSLRWRSMPSLPAWCST